MRTAKQILSTIRIISLSATKLQDKIQECALECLEHASVHGDCTLMDRLVKALPPSQRVEALVLWVYAFSPIRWSKDTAGNRANVGMLTKTSKMYTPFNLEEATASPYYSFTKENEPKPLTLEAILKIVQGLDKRIDKAIENDLIGEGEDVTAMKAYVVALKGVEPTQLTVH